MSSSRFDLSQEELYIQSSKSKWAQGRNLDSMSTTEKMKLDGVTDEVELVCRILSRLLMTNVAELIDKMRTSQEKYHEDPRTNVEDLMQRQAME